MSRSTLQVKQPGKFSFFLLRLDGLVQPTDTTGKEPQRALVGSAVVYGDVEEQLGHPEFACGSGQTRSLWLSLVYTPGTLWNRLSISFAAIVSLGDAVVDLRRILSKLETQFSTAGEVRVLVSSWCFVGVALALFSRIHFTVNPL
jgi:hypothetical protein